MTTLYVSDLDGTLLAPDGRISVRSLSIINGLIARGLPFTYATARSIHSARIVADGLRMELPAIIYNGAMLADARNGRIISSLSHSQETVAALRDMIGQTNAPMPFVYALTDGRESVRYMQGSLNDGMARYLASRPGDKRFACARSEDELFSGGVFYFTFIGAREELSALHQRALELDCVTLFQTELGRADEYWLEIMPRGATKAEAIARLKQQLGFERVVCFGDYPNDASMFSIADEAYAVGNADPALKALATGVIGDNAHDGVAVFLEERFAGKLANEHGR